MCHVLPCQWLTWDQTLGWFLCQRSRSDITLLAIQWLSTCRPAQRGLWRGGGRWLVLTLDQTPLLWREALVHRHTRGYTLRCTRDARTHRWSNVSLDCFSDCNSHTDDQMSVGTAMVTAIHSIHTHTTWLSIHHLHLHLLTFRLSDVEHSSVIFSEEPCGPVIILISIRLYDWCCLEQPDVLFFHLPYLKQPRRFAASLMDD